MLPAKLSRRKTVGNDYKRKIICEKKYNQLKITLKAFFMN
jgi:hypothetical protein